MLVYSHMKKCSMCGVEKPITEFYKVRKNEDGRNKTCKQCSNTLNKVWYLKNRQRQLELKTVWREKRRYEMRKVIWDYLKIHPCVDCGESDPIVLEFDHQKEKVKTVSEMATYGYNPERLMKEVKKCVIRCANCHRRKTAKQFNWYKRMYLKEREWAQNVVVSVV